MDKNEKKNMQKKGIVLLGFIALLLFTFPLFRYFEEQQKTMEYRQDDLHKLQTKITRADEDTECKNGIPICLSTTEGNVLIDNAGEYLISGNLDGNICIEAEEQIVHLFLDGVKISSSDGPAIRVYSAGKVIITILEDTKNYLFDSGKYALSDEENSCIYSECDITFNGKGMLEVYGYYKDAIHSKDKVKVLNSNISLKAKREGIRANDGILIVDASVNIECENDGLRTTKSGVEGKGAIEIKDSVLSIVAGRYAINSENYLFINNTEEYIKGTVSNYFIADEPYHFRETTQDE